MQSQQPTTGYFFFLMSFFLDEFPGPRRHRMKGEQRNATLTQSKRIERRRKVWIGFTVEKVNQVDRRRCGHHTTNKDGGVGASGAEQRMLNMGIRPKDYCTVHLRARARTGDTSATAADWAPWLAAGRPPRRRFSFSWSVQPTPPTFKPAKSHRFFFFFSSNTCTHYTRPYLCLC